MRYVSVEAKTVEYMFHGTCSENLRTILKMGLVPEGNFRKSLYDKQDYLQSLHGIYLTNDIRIAQNYAKSSAQQHRCEPVIVCVHVSYDNSSFSVDEDAVRYHTVLSKIPQHYLGNNLETYAVNDFQAARAFIDTFSDKVRPSALRGFEKICLKNNMMATINRWLKYSLYDHKVNKYPQTRNLTSKITSLLGRFLTSKTLDGHSWKNVALDKPIGYKGSTRIVSIWEQADIKGVYNRFIQIYGKPECNKLLEKHPNFHVLYGFHGIHDYQLYYYISIGKPVDLNLFKKQHGYLPPGLQTLDTSISLVDSTELPDNMTISMLDVPPNVRQLPKGLHVDTLDLSGNQLITTIPEDIFVEYLRTNRRIKQLPDNLVCNTLELLSPIRADNVRCKKFVPYYASNTLPKNVSVLNLDNMRENYPIPSGSFFKELYVFEYQQTLPDNLTVDGMLTLSYPGIKTLPENLTVSALQLRKQSSITEIPASIKVKELIISNLVKLPEGLKCKLYFESGLKREDLSYIPKSVTIMD